MMVDSTGMYSHCLPVALYGLRKTMGYSQSSTSQYLIVTSCCAGLSTGPLQSIGTDFFHCNPSNQDPYLVTLCGEFFFALAKHLMQIPGTAYSKPRTSVLLPHGLLW